MELKLHEAIQIVLKESGHPMSCREIADEVNKCKLYHRKKDTDPVPPGQINWRVKNYSLLFEKEGSLIRLVKY